jgi:predicted hydrocarbon binding protein
VSPQASAPPVSGRLVQWFLEAAAQEVGAEKLAAILNEGGFPPPVLERDSLARLDVSQAADLYDSLRRALCAVYGREARRRLVRIGRGMWDRLMQGADVKEKVELEVARRLPVPARRRRLLELVAARLREGGGEASVRRMDLDLLLADGGSASAAAQTSDEPGCAVTRGLVQAALFWGTGQEADVEETACRTAGASACEFRVKPGGK